MEPLETTGQFWLPDNDAKCVAGTLTWAPGAPARLTFESRLIDELAKPVSISATGGLQITDSGDAALIVADNVPRVILGDTELGPVTCIDAYLQHPPQSFTDLIRHPLRQIWDPYTLIIGTHLTEGHATEFDAVSVVLDRPGWWSHLVDSESASGAVGEIECMRDHDGATWLEFRPSSALSLRSADRAIRSVVTVAKLALDAQLTTIQMRIRKAGQTDWLEVKTRGMDPSKTSWPNPHNLLPSGSLTLERLLRWLTIEQKMDGLAAAVANPAKDNAIQVHALTACSLVEGIHKRIVGTDPTYVVRASDLHATAQRIDSEITTPVRDWAKLVKTARNDLAHHNTVVSLDIQLYNWMIVEASVIWVLRLCLLSHAGYTDAAIRTALANHDGYGFYRENLKQHVKERSVLLGP
ncbi:HEPN domain-containing protein [Nocardia brasiliensis]|uniref:ApeA N-terminal domain 1-containing protein n=1 Tax=Nocardia brasiliensis TaxID=37326 RepID=UPI0024584628|nr:HEPN domain-containing protein [Nocardia brasiliensis]